jgi:hypothetical protein
VRAPPARALRGGITVDDAEAELTGSWTPSAAIRPFIGAGYRHDGNAEKGTRSARFRAVLKPGRYEVLIAYTPHGNRATNVPVTVRHAGGAAAVRLDQRRKPPVDGLAASAGSFEFGAEGSVVISNDGTDGYVVIDAVAFVGVRS